MKEKEIRLEIPLECWGNLPSNRIWLKCGAECTETFKDRDFTKPISKEEKSIVLYIKVPEKLRLIEVVGLGGSTPLDNIAIGWCMEQANPNWKAPGLKKVQILAEGLNCEIPVIDEKPDKESLDKICSETGSRTWAMEVYTFEKEVIASFHWHPFLEEEAKKKVQKLYLSKGKEIPCIWEEGRLNGEEGKSIIVCGLQGVRKNAMYIEHRTANALIPVKDGEVIVKTDIRYDLRRCIIELFQIQKINEKFKEARIDLIARYINHQIDSNQLGINILRRNIEKFSRLDIYDRWYNEDVAMNYKEAILAAYDRANSESPKKPYFATTIRNN